MTGSRKRHWIAVALAALVVLSGCSAVVDRVTGGAADDPAMPTFENATAGAGIDYQGSGTGVGAGNNAVYASDVNNDGWTDLLVLGGQRPALFENDGGTFERRSSFPNVTARLKSATFVDYDGDGWEDVLLFVVEGEPIVFHNDGGTFDRTNVSLGNLTYPLGATAADYDGDGDRDLLVYQSGNWADRKPAGYLDEESVLGADNGEPNVLYENTGEGFERVDDAGFDAERWSLAASFVDLTGDGRPDVHVANDYNTDVVYVNRGNGTFTQRRLGGATARNGMASEIADVNGDGRPDILVTNIYIPFEENRDRISEERYDRLERLFTHVIKSDRTRGNTLLVNRGDGRFVDAADEYGVRHGGWGWAASLTDFTNDGVLDLVHTTQFVVRLVPGDPKWTYPMVWRGRTDNTSFARIDPSTHGMGEHDGRGMATLDYDRDGDRDVVIATYGGPLVLYENTVTGGNSLEFEVVDANGATALGATVTVTAGNRTTAVVQTDGNDFFSQESRVQHVGVGPAEQATVTVRWPDGTERSFEVETNQRIRLTKAGVNVVATYSR